MPWTKAPQRSAAVAGRSSLRPPPRDTRLDIVRGWMQVSIFISHVVGTSLAWGIHAAWGLSDSSEQFVFLSGLGLGSVFALKSARDGFGAARTDLAGRTLHLYRMHLMVVALFAALVLAAEMWLPLPGEVARLGWSWLTEAPWLALPAAATMLWQPEFMGILPVFVWCMLLLPPFMWLTERTGAWALLAPAALYGAVQGGLIATPGLGSTAIAFDPLAWQALFMTGAWLGRRALMTGEAVPRRGWMVTAAMAVVLYGLWVQLVVHGFIAGPADAAEALYGKAVLAPARLVHALALAYLVAVLVPREAAWMRAAPAAMLAMIGRHSLNVFCAGLFLSWAASTVLASWPGHAGLLDPLLIASGIGVLLLVALASERRRTRLRPARATA
ncbi:MAG TPA: OpgC domain-containing protein [Falsiroseomonas sp.]|nr:OpgC domain-containing protein [Falsiroseomonas sp.]